MDKLIYLEQHSLYLYQKNTLRQNLIKLNMIKEQAIAQCNSAKSDVVRIKGLLDNDKARLERMKQVIDIIARNDYEEVQKNINNLTEQLIMSQHKEVGLKKRIFEVEQEVEVYKDQMFSEWLKELVQKQKELRILESEINSITFQNQKQQIIAPLDGYVGKLLVNTEGGVVTPAEKLISIIPENAPLIIKATVLNKDIGFIKRGMNSAIKIDTFSFQKYGSLDGIVKSIGHDAIDDKKLGLVYEIKITPKKTTLKIEGEDKSIEPGMSVIAEIKVGKRRIIEFFIYPLIKHMDEGMSVK